MAIASNLNTAPERKRLRRILGNMKTRCYDPRHKCYGNYGGRNIGVCDAWRFSLDAFHEWAIRSGYRNDLEIDRIDNSKGYGPDNCRWVTQSQQNANVRRRPNMSGYRGVRKGKNRWRARISTPGSRGKKMIWLGTFPTKLQAAFAFDDAACAIHGEFAVLNFPERIRARQKNLVSALGGAK